MAEHEPSTEEKDRITQINQRGSDRTIQIGQVFGNVRFNLVTFKTAMVVLGVVLLLASGIAYSYYLYIQPVRMEGKFNIAVAQFGEISDDGDIVTSKPAAHLSNQLFNELAGLYKQIPEIEVTHKNIGPILEDADAEKIAYKTNADVVIYGNVVVLPDRDLIEFLPSFYISNQPDANELTGVYQTSEITFTKKSLDAQELAEAELNTRARVLVAFTQGLVNFYTGKYRSASAYFDDATKYAGSELSAEKAVLYGFLAATYNERDDFDKALETIDTALNHDQKYARVYNLQGNVYYQRALHQGDDEALLEKAEVAYWKAIELEAQQPGNVAYVREKANLGLGNVYLLQAQYSASESDKLFDSSYRHYQEVIEWYDETENKFIKEMAATAFFGQGAIYALQEQYVKSTEAFSHSIQLAEDPVLQSRYRLALGNAYKDYAVSQLSNDMATVELAIRQYEQVIDAYEDDKREQMRALAIEANANLGQVYHGLEQYELAKAAYSQVLTLAENRFERTNALFNLGFLHDDWGFKTKSLETLDIALDYYQEVIDLHHQSEVDTVRYLVALSNCNKGIIYQYAKNELDNAQKAYEQCQALADTEELKARADEYLANLKN